MTAHRTSGDLTAIRARAELSIAELQAGGHHYDALVMHETLRAVVALTSERDRQAVDFQKVRELCDEADNQQAIDHPTMRMVFVKDVREALGGQS